MFNQDVSALNNTLLTQYLISKINYNAIRQKKETKEYIKKIKGHTQLSNKQNQISVSLRVSTVTTLVSFLIVFTIMSTNTQAQDLQGNSNKGFYIQNYSTYQNSGKNTIIVGSVAASHNLTLTSPVEITIGLNVYNDSSKRYDIIKEHPFKRLTYNIDEPVPFKFTINPTKHQIKSGSVPFIYDIKKAELQSPNINTFELKYNESNLGPSKELYGTVKNTAPNTIKNLTLYAIVHGKNGAQVDSVKTKISNIEPQETVNFSFVPDKAIENLVFTYSCVGGELEDINSYQSIHISPNQTLGYKFSGFMEIDSLNYDNKTGQFSIKVDNVYPVSSSLSLQLKPEKQNPLSIEIDGHTLDSKFTNGNNTTIVDLAIPQGKHEIDIYNINKQQQQ
jgi:hypothetical protein